MTGQGGQYQGQYLNKQFGNYRLIKLLGEGGFAEVYQGEHIHLGTYAAIKVLTLRMSRQDIEMFQQEARTIAHLEHPHIVRVFDCGVEQGIPFLVMNYAPQGSLRHLHPRGTRLPLPTIISYVNQVASALQYAHDQGLVHRDVKPDNMLLGNNHEILLSDFDIATSSITFNSQKTQNQAGTWAYMAPEQMNSRPRRASDQYSLAIIVYEWLTSTPPFEGSISELYIKHTSVAPPSLRTTLPDLSERVEEVVLRALAKDPDQRFPSVKDFAEALAANFLIVTSDPENNIFLAAAIKDGKPQGEEHLLSTAPTVPDAAVARLLEQGRKEIHSAKAIQAYDQALALDPKNTDALWRKAVLLTYNLAKPEEALPIYDQIFSINPHDLDALGEKANVLHMLPTRCATRYTARKQRGS